MATSEFHLRPRLLMLADAFPQRVGAAARKRAWQLFDAAMATHEVWLIVVNDAPVNLRQWREVAGRTGSFAMIGRGGVLASREMETTVAEWSQRTRFHTVLATSLALWPVARAVEAEVRACDVQVLPAANGWIDRFCGREARDLQRLDAVLASADAVFTPRLPAAAELSARTTRARIVHAPTAAAIVRAIRSEEPALRLPRLRGEVAPLRRAA